MKILFAFLFVNAFTLTASAQYYYKDIIGTKETSEIIRNYQKNKVTRVLLNSYDGDNTKNDDFFVEQVFIPGSLMLKTITRSGLNNETILLSYFNDKGEVIKTVDSSETLTSTSHYNYNPSGLLLSVSSVSIDSSKSFMQSEEHKWEYNGDRIVRMLRIKNKKDTNFVHFKLDEKGNITEERSVRNGQQSEPVYYFYDNQNRLIDIVRFNSKARRLLPEYMFEYSANNKVIQKITVPSNGSEYLIWRYQYDPTGLKVKEAIYNKQKQLTGKIEYQYQKG